MREIFYYIMRDEESCLKVLLYEWSPCQFVCGNPQKAERRISASQLLSIRSESQVTMLESIVDVMQRFFVTFRPKITRWGLGLYLREATRRPKRRCGRKKSLLICAQCGGPLSCWKIMEAARWKGRLSKNRMRFVAKSWM